MVGAGLLAKQGGRARARAPALGEDEPRARLEGGHRLPRPLPASPRTWRSSGSTSSVTGARPASGTRARCRTEISRAIEEGDLAAVSVLSGNRNFEGRIHSEVKMNYLASPPLVVAYALAGQHGHRPRQRAARRWEPTASRSTCATSGHRSRRSSEVIAEAVQVGDVPQQLRGRLRGRRALERSRDPGGRHLRLARVDLRPEAAVLRRHGPGARAGRAAFTARACWRCWATASRPTTSRRPARSGRTARRGAT